MVSGGKQSSPRNGRPGTTILRLATMLLLSSSIAEIATAQSPVPNLMQLPPLPSRRARITPSSLPTESLVQTPSTPAMPEQLPTPEATVLPTPPAETATAISEIAAAPTEVIQTDTAAPNAEQAATPTPIYLNFENTDLSSFINYMADLKEKNLIPNESTTGVKISLTIREPLTVDEAWNVFTTVLEMSGFTTVERDINGKKLLKVVQRDAKYTEPLPVYIGIPAEQLPNSDETVRYVTFLNNLTVTDQQVEQLLTSMLTQGAGVIRQDSLNGFIITDKCYNIKSAMKVLNELDNSGYQETVSVMRLKRASAADVKQLLEQIIKKPEQSSLARLLGYNAEGTSEYFSSSTKIIAEERTNALILLGTQKSIQKVEEFVAEYIDQELKKPASPVHVYELQFAEAEQVKAVLDEVTQGQQSAASKFGSTRGGVKYFNSITTEVDKQGNRLLVSCADKQDWPLLEQTIKDLDKPQPQVAIETLIVQIDNDDMKQLGGQVRNQEHGSPIPGVDAQSAGLAPIQLERSGTDVVSILGNLLNTISGGLAVGSTAVTLGKVGSVWAVFRALKTETNASILDRPFITVANRTKGKVTVGEKRRVIKEQAITDNPSNYPAGYETLPASTSIEYEPQINPDGVINLKVNIDLSAFLNDNGDRSDKTLKTSVTVANGQVLVLGGFVKTKITEAHGKSPVLGDIPIVGWLFKNKTRHEVKSYIFLFVSPTIVKPRQSPGSNLYTKMKLHEATRDVDESVEAQVSHDPIHNWFFNPEREDYSHKVVDFANARYQPTTVDIRSDPYYRSKTVLELGTETTEPELLQPDTMPRISAIPPIAVATHDALPVTPKTSVATKNTVNAETATEQSNKIPSVESQREQLKSLVAGTTYAGQKPLTKAEMLTPRGQFKSFIASLPAEEEKQEHEKYVDTTREAFKGFIAPRTSTPQQPVPQQGKPSGQSTISQGRNLLKQLVAENPMQSPFNKKPEGQL